MKLIWQRHEQAPDERCFDIRIVLLNDGRRVLVTGKEMLVNHCRTDADLLRLARELAYDADYGGATPG